MSKPTALSEPELAEIETRLAKGWVIRRDQIEALIAMARERNAATLSPQAVPPQYIPTTLYPGKPFP